MRTSSIKTIFKVAYTITVMMLTLMGCVMKPMSEKVKDSSVKWNGGFEYVRDGLPVNWLFYTEKTINGKKHGSIDVPATDFDLIIDTVDYREGRQSLKFVVRQCGSAGEWHSPGFCDEFEVDGDRKYMVTFWVKNNGSEFELKAGAVKAMGGAGYETIRLEKDIKEWQKLEIPCTVPAGMRLRINVNVLRPGTFQIYGISFREMKS